MQGETKKRRMPNRRNEVGDRLKAIEIRDSHFKQEWLDRAGIAAPEVFLGLAVEVLLGQVHAIMLAQTRPTISRHPEFIREFVVKPRVDTRRMGEHPDVKPSATLSPNW